MLAHAGVCGRMQATHVAMVRGDGTVTVTDREVRKPLLTYADVCWRMLTYADVMVRGDGTVTVTDREVQ
jgi:hypothetical protein